MKKQCSNPKCRRGKITIGESGVFSFGGSSYTLECSHCGAPFEDVKEFYPEQKNVVE